MKINLHDLEDLLEVLYGRSVVIEGLHAAIQFEEPVYIEIPIGASFGLEVKMFPK
jgi:hypothetical protein